MKCSLLVSLFFAAAISVAGSNNCSGILINSTGSFGSPAIQSGVYPNNANCKWKINVPQGGKITINFVKFYTEACCDYVKITNEIGDLIAKYSGQHSLPFTVTVAPSQAKRIDITFKSDNSEGKPGFQAIYSIHDQLTTAPPLLPTTVPKAAGARHSLMDALLKMKSSLTRILMAVSQIPKIKDDSRKDMLKLNSELYQAVKVLHTLKTISSASLPKHEIDQINLDLMTIRYKASPAIMRLNRLLTPDVCKLPKEAGSCSASFPKFFYNDTSEQCEQFSYGGCQGNANSFDKIEDCKKLCVRERLCPKGVRIYYCFADPCSVNSCPAYSSRCQSNYCGGCNAFFYDQHNIRIPKNRCHCQPSEPKRKCVADPCQVTSCPSHPNAKCRARRCGCTAEFVEADGSIVKTC